MKTTTGYQDVKIQVLEKIRTKEWPLGHILPSEVELAQEFGCARATVNRALALLAEQGVIDRKRKAGSRVSPYPKKLSRIELKPVRAEVEDQAKDYHFCQVARQFGDPPKWMIDDESVKATDQILYIETIHFAGNQPFQYQETWINASSLPHAVDQDFKQVAPCVWLLSETPLCNGQFRLNAKLVDGHEATHLGLQVGAAALQKHIQMEYDGQLIAVIRMVNDEQYAFQGAF